MLMEYKFDNPLNEKTIQQIQEHKKSFLLLGISLIVLGTLATIFAYSSTIFSVIYLGIFLIILGIFEGVQSFTLSRWSNFFLHLFLGVLYTVGGFFIVINPTANAVSLTLLLAIFFVVSGILKVVFALSKNVPHKGWLALNGVVTFILGALIWYQWPLSGLWVIGMLVGIDAVFTGWTLIMLSMASKKLGKNSTSPHHV